MSQRAKLEAHVKAVNRVHKYTKELFATLRPIFEQLVGQKITKADGSLLAKVEKLLPKLGTDDVMVWRSTSSNYSLVYYAKTCVSCDGHGIYYEDSVYIGEMSDGVLIKLYDNYDVRDDFTADEIEQKREAYFKARELADDAKSALHPFGEYTR